MPKVIFDEEKMTFFEVIVTEVEYKKEGAIGALGRIEGCQGIPKQVEDKLHVSFNPSQISPKQARSAVRNTLAIYADIGRTSTKERWQIIATPADSREFDEETRTRIIEGIQSLGDVVDCIWEADSIGILLDIKPDGLVKQHIRDKIVESLAASELDE